MTELADRMIATGYEFVELANKMMKSCRQKDKKVRTYNRAVISFFMSRAAEGFESFLLLLRNNRLADAAVLFRSFCEMGIDTAYIFSDPKLKDLRVMQYLLNESKEVIKTLDKNKDELSQDGYKVDERLEKKRAGLEKMKTDFAKQFKEGDWRWPTIEKRVELSKNEVIRSMYYQVYAFTSNIEHHNMLFGRDYISLDDCGPAEVAEPNPLLRPELHLIIFRSILLVIMKIFNEEYHLKWEKALESLGEKQGQDYREIH
jgi:hypothetical protein